VQKGTIHLNAHVAEGAPTDQFDLQSWLHNTDDGSATSACMVVHKLCGGGQALDLWQTVIRSMNQEHVLVGAEPC